MKLINCPTTTIIQCTAVLKDTYRILFLRQHWDIRSPQSIFSRFLCKFNLCVDLQGKLKSFKFAVSSRIQMETGEVMYFLWQLKRSDQPCQLLINCVVIKSVLCIYHSLFWSNYQTGLQLAVYHWCPVFTLREQANSQENSSQIPLTLEAISSKSPSLALHIKTGYSNCYHTY